MLSKLAAAKLSSQTSRTDPIRAATMAFFGRAMRHCCLCLGVLTLASCQMAALGGDSQPRRVEASARSPLWTGDVEKPGYGIYSYLLFGSASELGFQRRIIAASAFLELVPDRQELGVHAVPAANLSMFYIPIQGTSYRPDTLSSGSPEWLVSNYDYERAGRLLGQIGEHGADIYIVSTLGRLTMTKQPQRDQLLVQNFSRVPTQAIPLWIREFGQEVYWDASSFREAMHRLKSKEPSVAAYVEFAGMDVGS